MTVTALGGSRQLLQVKVAQMPARRLHNAPAVRPGVVGVALTQSQPLSHLPVLVLMLHEDETPCEDLAWAA